MYQSMFSRGGQLQNEVVQIKSLPQVLQGVAYKQLLFHAITDEPGVAYDKNQCIHIHNIISAYNIEPFVQSLIAHDENAVFLLCIQLRDLLILGAEIAVNTDYLFNILTGRISYTIN